MAEAFPPIARLVALLTSPDREVGVHVRVVSFNPTTGILNLTIGVHRGETLLVVITSEVRGFWM